MCVMPTEAQMLPKPVTPFCLAPHGTASIFSSMALSGWFFFFLSPALRGNAASRTSDETRKVLILIKPPGVCALFTPRPGRCLRPQKRQSFPVAKQSKLHGEWDGRYAAFPIQRAIELLLIRFGLGGRRFRSLVVVRELLRRFDKDVRIGHQLLARIGVRAQIFLEFRMALQEFPILHLRRVVGELLGQV